MAKNDTTNLTELFLQCMGTDPIQQRTRVVGIFPNPDSYPRLVATFLME